MDTTDPAIGPVNTVQRPQFENAQVRITRVVVAPGDELALALVNQRPALLVALTPVDAAAGRDARNLSAGRTAKVESGPLAEVRSSETSSSEPLQFDFKARPSESHD